MDFSSFKTSDWLKVGGTIAFVVFGFFTWVEVSMAGFGSETENVFGFTWTGLIPWLIFVAVGVLTALLRTGKMKAGTAPWPLILMVLSIIAATLVLLRLLFNPLENKDLFEAAGGEVSRGFGLYLCSIAAIAIAVGGVMGFTESGGDFKDLTDVDKLKGQFARPAGGGSAPPPPPPGGGTPPPPPPPPPPAP